MQIVILGIFAADATFRADRLPDMGETLIGRGFALGPGGKGSNQAVAAARAGGDVALVTRLGQDDFAGLARKIWAAAGVRAEVVKDPESHTGAAFIFVNDATGDNAIIVTPGAAGRLCVADVERHAGLVAGARVFATQLEQPLPAARRALEIARAAGVRTVLNPAPAAPLDDGLLALCDVLTPNETEAAALTGLAVADPEGAARAAAALRARGAGAVAVTLGAQGALWQDATGTVRVPAFDAGPVVETTGAGDAFNGAFAVALAEGLDGPAAVRFGCAAASISVTRPGTAASMPSRAEIEALLARG
ncbi:MAG: ribokinase [Gemmobacter sp.]